MFDEAAAHAFVIAKAAIKRDLADAFVGLFKGGSCGFETHQFDCARRAQAGGGFVGA